MKVAVVSIVLTLLQGSLAFLKSPSGSTQNRMGLFLSSSSTSQPKDKRIVFVRHGCTYMNEYLGKGTEFGGPNFTDVFSSPEDKDKYRDSKLSPRGVSQATALAKRLTKELKGRQRPDFVPSDLDLIVISPLTRALQTFELGLKPVLQDLPNVLALPLAAERVFLISDQGRPRSDLQQDWGDSVDFETGFRHDNDDDDNLVEEWWFGLDDQRSAAAIPTGITTSSYEEWRPSSQNQKYACPAEDEESFEERMRKLYQWLGDRPESTIAVVCHWGVIDWFLDRDFMNCEVGVVPFEDIRPPTMTREEEALKQSI
jgi:broad specificity phosphatase PhoE